MAVSKTPPVAARELGKRYRRASGAEVWALRDVSLEVKAGEVCVLTGPSGSGKSTLLALLGALEVPTQGEVLHYGASLRGVSDHELARARRRVGFLLQGSALLPRLPLWENVAYPLIPRGVTAVERFRRAEALLGALGLAGLERSCPEELSGGERQRAALARALVGEPEIVLADEPTSHLDAATAAVIIRHLSHLRRQGVVVITATHDPALIGIADRVVALIQGRHREDD